jgi:iron-sulfur cluster repair protein YtfE (RIC family)
MFTIGRRPTADEPTEQLRACHERIRRFLAMAERLASDTPAPGDDLRATAAAVVRYFDEALPLHERDEDDSIATLLAGAEPAIASAVADMRAQHAEMHPLVDALVATCRRVERADDAALARALERAELTSVLARLGPRMAAHLAAEEELILPAIDALPPATRAALAVEMRARRES